MALSASWPTLVKKRTSKLPRRRQYRLARKKVYVEDLRREFIEELGYPAVYANVYLLGRHLIPPLC
jgi:argininosuccinate synthase